MTLEEIYQRMNECPYRQVGQLLKDSYCTRYNGTVIPCNGACAWVVDYPRLKEIQNGTEG